MQTYQLETAISGTGTITLPPMPGWNNKRVSVFITLVDEEKEKPQSKRKQAFEQILKMQSAMQPCTWTDEYIDRMKYERLIQKYW